MKNPGAKKFPDGVVDGIAQNGRNTKRHQQDIDIQRSLGSQSAQRKQKRIARQNGRHHQTGLAKNHQKHNHVSPDAEHLDNLIEVFVQMNKKIYKINNDVHE